MPQPALCIKVTARRTLCPFTCARVGWELSERGLSHALHSGRSLQPSGSEPAAGRSAALLPRLGLSTEYRPLLPGTGMPGTEVTKAVPSGREQALLLVSDRMRSHTHFL